MCLPSTIGARYGRKANLHILFEPCHASAHKRRREHRHIAVGRHVEWAMCPSSGEVDAQRSQVNRRAAGDAAKDEAAYRRVRLNARLGVIEFTLLDS